MSVAERRRTERASAGNEKDSRYGWDSAVSNPNRGKLEAKEKKSKTKEDMKEKKEKKEKKTRMKKLSTKESNDR
jgi:hypothetical protein